MAYLRLAILAAFLAVSAVALWYRSSAISAEADAARARIDLKTAFDTNMAQLETIGRLRAEADFADRLTAELAEQLRSINAKISETKSAVDALKGQDETVRSYLDTPVPDPLRRLYDR